MVDIDQSDADFKKYPFGKKKIQMKSNLAFDRDGKTLSADSYGTFADDDQGSPTTTTTFSADSYGISSQSSTVLILGTCPACKTGILEMDFTCLGVCCAIIFFPIGILCCLAFRQRRCNFCGAIYP